MSLYHYTCVHTVERIGRSGCLRPHPQVMLRNIALIWLTDLDQPDRTGLGLTSDMLRCDRAAYRLTVPTTPAITRWHTWARARRLGLSERDQLERGCLPAHWWVCETPLPVLAVEATR